MSTSSCGFVTSNASTNHDHQVEPPAKKAKTEFPLSKKKVLVTATVTDDPYLLTNEDIWFNILSFVGPGQFAFVAGVSLQFKEWYKIYFSTFEEETYEEDFPQVIEFKKYGKNRGYDYDIQETRESRFTDTFYSNVFSSVSCAEFWINNAKGKHHQLRLPDDRICEMVAKFGNLEVLKWARQKQGFSWDVGTPQIAASKGYFGILQYAHTNGCPWNEYTCSAAAGGGYLDILKYARDNGCPWDWGTCANASWYGHLDVLKYAHKNGCPWDEMTCSYAARYGTFDCLKYAHENGCPWTERTCTSAARRGSLEILKYAHENGCPWDALTCAEAASKGYFDILKYARSHGCPWDEFTTRWAVAQKHHEIAQWAYENGCPWPAGIPLPNQDN